MKLRSTYKHTIPAGGGTTTIPISSPYEQVHLVTSGATVLAGNYNLTYSGTPAEGHTIEIFAELTNLTSTGFTVTLYGEAITAEILENVNFRAIATYSVSASGFVVTVIPDFEGSGFIQSAHIATSAISSAKIAADAVTLEKLSDITRGSLIVGGVANAPTLRDFKTSGRIPIGDGTDIQSVAVSGDATLSSAGVLTIADGVITEDNLSFSLASYLEVTRTLTSAEILAGYSANTNTGYEVIAAPGVGKYIEIVSTSAYNNYAAATYAAGANTLNLEINGVSVWTFPNSFIEATSSTASQGTKVVDAAIATNNAVKVHVGVADPTVGDGTIKVSIIYRIITGE
jgi:hypothetical protein